MSSGPTKNVKIDGNNVEIVVECHYDTNAKDVWLVASNFSSLKTLFTNIIKCDLVYPKESNGNYPLVGSERHLTFHGVDGVTIEVLKELDNDSYRFTYIQKQGLPVTDYVARVGVATGTTGCTLIWEITYVDTNDGKLDFARKVGGFFVEAMQQIATVLGVTLPVNP